MNKKFVAIMAGSSVVLLSMCSSSNAFAENEIIKNNTPLIHNNSKDLLEVSVEQTLEKEFIEQINIRNMVKAMEEKIAQEKLENNTIIMQEALAKLITYAGKTRYVFAGSSPSGWDCSGLVLWFYSHFEIELYHSATVQMEHGVEVAEPKPGDIVAFQWEGSSRAYHVGIYLEEDTMIDAGSSRSGTKIRSISNFGGENTKIKYVRIVDTN